MRVLTRKCGANQIKKDEEKKSICLRSRYIENELNVWDFRIEIELYSNLNEVSVFLTLFFNFITIPTVWLTATPFGFKRSLNVHLGRIGR